MDKKIIKFIEEAKKRGYASQVDTFKRTKEGGKTCVFKKGNLTYTDTYFGNLIDCGQERVYENGKVIWVMAYRGGIIKHQELHFDAFYFLKKCISKMPKNFPARGPKVMKDGKWRYENKWKGNIESFTGEENIYYQGEKICFRYYLGGLIKNKSK
ncbi:hypothetical protein FJZ17_03430 [Candidatus Pacearchaeota archaeon]|nr:hypothetical protein [Candidatus Pacearchaeota archaeon]